MKIKFISLFPLMYAITNKISLEEVSVYEFAVYCFHNFEFRQIGGGRADTYSEAEEIIKWVVEVFMQFNFMNNPFK